LFEDHSVVGTALVPPEVSVGLCYGQLVKRLMVLYYPPDGVENQTHLVHQIEQYSFEARKRCKVNHGHIFDVEDRMVARIGDWVDGGQDVLEVCSTLVETLVCGNLNILNEIN